jgi:tripartite-type tricarboxylate transporter receptor subunit TctC
MTHATRTAAAAIAALMLPPAALAQGAADFSGKTVTIIASFEAGGPYDFYARLIGRHIGAHIPGKPNVIVQNMPGAGGLRGANYIYNVAPKDGTAMGVMSQTVAVGEVLATTPGIQYEARKYTWIGRMNANVEVDHAWHASGVRSIQDVMQRETVAAGTGPTSSSVVMRRLMNELVGTRYKVVTGFRDPPRRSLPSSAGRSTPSSSRGRASRAAPPTGCVTRRSFCWCSSPASVTAS